MENRTKNIKLLLLLSESIDKYKTTFKLKMFNKILYRIKFEDLTEQENEEQMLSAKEIITYICTYYKVKYDDLLSNSRKQPLTTVRHITATLLMDNTDLNLNEIGKILNRDHSSILHAHKKIDIYFEVDKRFKLQFEHFLFKSRFNYKTYTPKQ